MVLRSAKSEPLPKRLLPRWDDLSELVRGKTDVRAYLRDGSEQTLTEHELHAILTWHLQDRGILPR